MKRYFMFYQELDKKLDNIPTVLISIVLVTIVATIAFNMIEIKEGKAIIGYILIWIASLLGVASAGFFGWIGYLFSLWIKNDFLTAFKETQVEFEYTPKKTGKVNFE